MDTAETGAPRRPRDPGGTTSDVAYERYRGYGVMALPFDSGHVLALRVMPENDFVPFRAVWHRTPSGAWAMYVDAPEHELLCPRLFGPALAGFGPARISVDWTGGRRLSVRMDEPELAWTVELRRSPFTRLAGRVLRGLSLSVYRRGPTLALVRRLADLALGLGPMDLAGELPGGQRALVKPDRILLVDDARAVLEGEDLGSPARVEENPSTGDFRWPARGVLAEGEVYVEIDDPAEHARRVERFRRAGAG